MLSECWLHIGCEKTGTTSIQHFLARNRDRLAEVDWLYPKAPGPTNHLGLTAYAQEDTKIDDVRIWLGIRGATKAQQYRYQLTRKLERELASSPVSRAVFSGEHMSSRLHADSEIARLKALCDTLAARTRVIVYIRNQADFLASWYATQVLCGETRPLAWPPTTDVFRLMDYEAMLALWEGVFGHENVIVRRFEPDDFPDGSLLADFARCLGIETEGFAAVAPQNPALDASALAFLRVFNRLVPPFKGKQVDRRRGPIAEAMQEKFSSREPLKLPGWMAEEIELRFRESNRRVAENWFGGEHNPLFAPPQLVDAAARETNDKLDHALSIVIASQLWTWQQRRINRLEKQLASLTRPKREEGGD